jgi:hypothetical protein
MRNSMRVVFQRDCGATTDFSTQISIVVKGKPLSDTGGNVFVADSDGGKAPRAGWGGPPADIEWLGNRKLRVITHPDSRIFRKEISVPVSIGVFSMEKVSIEYVLKGS